MAGLVGRKLVFEGEKDHADGGDDLGQREGADGPDVRRAMMKQRKRFFNVQRPGKEAKAGKDSSQRKAAEDIEHEQGGDKVEGALHEEERRVAGDAYADPESGSAEDDA